MKKCMKSLKMEINRSGEISVDFQTEFKLIRISDHLLLAEFE